MNNLRQFRAPNVLKLISLLRTECRSHSSKSEVYFASFHILQHYRFCRTGISVNFSNGRNLGELAKKSRVVKAEAESGLFDYFHYTRGFPTADAENMSENTPNFFYSLVKRVEIEDTDVKRALRRYLRYHPINEFEPFFESIGLKPSEYSSFLPRNKMFLNEDELLLENYGVLCRYGVERNKIGRIYREAREVFGYEKSYLGSRLRCLEDLGLKKSLIANIVTMCPRLLVGNVDMKFLEVLEKLKKLGINYDWLDENVSVIDSCDWNCMLELVCLLSELDLRKDQIREMLTKHPCLLLECSGHMTFGLIVFMLKFGHTFADVQDVLLQFPEISVVKFTNNLYNCYQFLVEIDMDVQDIGWIVRSHLMVMGSCELKTYQSLLTSLNCGKYKICEMVMDDPNVLKKWILGVRVDPLPGPKKVLVVRMLKTKFLLSLGFVENSKEMENAFKALRGRGVELQERLDCLVNLGLSRDDVLKMVKLSPQILNQSQDVVAEKIRFFLEDLHFPVSDLVTHPKLICYSTERLKLRLLTYKWLKHERPAHPKLAVSTLLASSEEEFVKTYVNSHPGGPEFWNKLKNEIYSG